jgi:hypothetical protein
MEGNGGSPSTAISVRSNVGSDTEDNGSYADEDEEVPLVSLLPASNLYLEPFLKEAKDRS